MISVYAKQQAHFKGKLLASLGLFHMKFTFIAGGLEDRFSILVNILRRQ